MSVSHILLSTYPRLIPWQAGGSCRMGWQSYKNIIYLPLPPLSHTTCLSPRKTFSLSWLERECALFSLSSHCPHKQGYHSTGRPKQTTGLAGPFVWILLRCLSHRGLLFLFYCSPTVFSGPFLSLLPRTSCPDSLSCFALTKFIFLTWFQSKFPTCPSKEIPHNHKKLPLYNLLNK